MLTSSKSIGKKPFELAKINVTSAMFIGLRLLVREKITSFMRPPRKLLADCSPMTQRMASITLDFPLPFGPTTAVTPLLNSIMVGSAKDLNPFTFNVFNCTRQYPFYAQTLICYLNR